MGEIDVMQMKALVSDNEETKELVLYENARRALAEARTIDEVKQVKNKAHALKLYGKQAKDTDLENYAAEIKLRAQRKLGELSREIEKLTPKESGPMAQGGLPNSGKTSKAKILEEAGISTSVAHRCEQIAAIPEQFIERYIADKREKKQPVYAAEVIKMTGKRVRRAQKTARILGKEKPLADIEPAHVIYADPPWQYHNVISESRRVENQYPTMSLEAIKALDVAKVAAKDCVLFLWATSPTLAEALDVMKAWGFQYKTCAVWVKESIGPGHWFRQQHELLLLGTKGEIPVPEPENRPPSLIRGDRGAHSEKPDAVYDIIEKAFPEFSKLELFCRKPRDGWLVWGNEIEHD